MPSWKKMVVMLFLPISGKFYFEITCNLIDYEKNLEKKTKKIPKYAFLYNLSVIFFFTELQN